MKLKIVYVLIVFVVETVVQILYSSIEIKYFSSLQELDAWPDIFTNGLFVIGGLKAAFFLPIYLIYHLMGGISSSTKLFLTHALLFAVIYFFLILFVPHIILNFMDAIVYIVISFLSCLVVFYTFPPFKGILIPKIKS
jgi:hypothetical protein